MTNFIPTNTGLPDINEDREKEQARRASVFILEKYGRLREGIRQYGCIQSSPYLQNLVAEIIQFSKNETLPNFRRRITEYEAMIEARVPYIDIVNKKLEALRSASKVIEKSMAALETLPGCRPNLIHDVPPIVPKRDGDCQGYASTKVKLPEQAGRKN